NQAGEARASDRPADQRKDSRPRHALASRGVEGASGGAAQSLGASELDEKLRLRGRCAFAGNSSFRGGVSSFGPPGRLTRRSLAAQRLLAAGQETALGWGV